MFPHTHAYTTKEIIGKADSLLIYGSILPDIAITKLLDWDIISKKSKEFRDWLISKDKSYSNLGLGMMLHEFPCGIDRFTHNSYRGNSGYAFENSKSIIDEVSLCCSVTQEQSKSLAHDLIETGLEFLLIQDNPSVTKLVKTSLESINIKKTAKYFAQFYGTKEDKTYYTIKFYNHFIVKRDYNSVDSFVGIWEAIAKQLLGKNIDRGKTRKVILKSIEIVRPTYKEFISYVIKECKEDVKKYI